MRASEQQIQEREAEGVSRRQLLLSLPALAMARHAFAQGGSPPLRVRGINHVTLAVSDVKRSVDFYQGLFGMPVISRQGMTTNLQIGAGPQFLGVSSAGSNAPAINHLCLGVDDFNVDRITTVLGQRGMTMADAAGNAGGGGLGGGPMRMRVRRRGPEAGGAKEGTPGDLLQRPRQHRDATAGPEVLRRIGCARRCSRHERRRQKRGCSSCVTGAAARSLDRTARVRTPSTEISSGCAFKPIKALRRPCSESAVSSSSCSPAPVAAVAAELRELPAAASITSA